MYTSQQSQQRAFASKYARWLQPVRPNYKTPTATWRKSSANSLTVYCEVMSKYVFRERNPEALSTFYKEHGFPWLLLSLVKNKSSQRPHTSAKENTVWIPSPDPDYFQNLMGPSVSKNTSVIKLSWKARSLCPETVEKCPVLQCWRIVQIIPGSGGGRLPKI